MEYHADCLGESTLFPLSSCLHAHQPVVSRLRARPRSCSRWGTHKQLRGEYAAVSRVLVFARNYMCLPTVPGHDEYFIGTMMADRVLAADGRFGRDNNEGVRHWSFIGDRHVDARGAAFGRYGPQAALGAAGQFHGRSSTWQGDDTHVAPPHAGAQPRSQRLGASRLGGESLGIGFDTIAPLIRFGPFRCRE